MVEATKNEAVASHHWWWLERNNLINRKRSPWLQSELAELNEKTKTMLELIEVDADSFAQRADLYFEKRPELINLVEDLYRFHRSLAVQFDHLKSHLFSSSEISEESDIHHAQVQPLEESHSDQKIQPQVFEEIESDEEATSYHDKNNMHHSQVQPPEESHLDLKIQLQVSEEIESDKEATSYHDKNKEADENDANSDQEEIRPQESEEIESEKEKARSYYDKEEEVKENDELLKLKEEMDRVKAENWNQKEQLMRKDEEKREVIRQLSVAIDLLREENVNLRQEMGAIRVSSRSHNQREEGFCSRLLSAFD